MTNQELAAFIWSVADLLRGDYKQSDYGKIILPFTILRRLDCVLEPTKQAVLTEFNAQKNSGLPLEPFLLPKANQSFFNTSAMDLPKLLGDPANIKANLTAYINGFSANVRDIFERYDFEKQIDSLDRANLLFKVVQKFAGIDLHPNVVSNMAMGQMFEELIRRFAELSNETAGEHFTPREVIKLMVNLLFEPDDAALSEEGIVRTIYDPTAGTGGMLSVAEEHLLTLNPKAKLAMHGQELNPESYAICKGDMLVKGQDVTNIILGNTLSNDGHASKKFDYMLSNPPFGVEWKKVEEEVRKEHEQKGANGRFGPGLPRVSDGSLLFLLHLISKMRDPEKGGSRIGIVLNGSPLFTGGAGSGESEIRKYVLENDLVEAIIALPTDMFYNTGISTYIWILTNHKRDERKKKVQLIDASAFWQKMRKSLGSKRKEMSANDIATVTQLYGAFADQKLASVLDAAGKTVSQQVLMATDPDPKAPEGGSVDVAPVSKIFNTKDFGYTTITVERPLRLKFEVRQESLDYIDEFEKLNKKGVSKEDVENLRAILKSAGIGAKWATKKEMGAALATIYKKLGIEPSTWMRKTIANALEYRHPEGEIQFDSKGKPEPDSELRDTENVPLTDDIKAYFEREVKPHASDAWVDTAKSKVGYEIPFNRHFYVFKPPRDLSAIDHDLKAVTDNIMKMLGGLKA